MKIKKYLIHKQFKLQNFITQYSWPIDIYSKFSYDLSIQISEYDSSNITLPNWNSDDDFRKFFREFTYMITFLHLKYFVKFSTTLAVNPRNFNHLCTMLNLMNYV